MRLGEVLTNFVGLFDFAGIRQQMLKLGSTGQIQADQRISGRSKPQSRLTEIVFADFDFAFGRWYSEHAEEF